MTAEGEASDPRTPELRELVVQVLERLETDGPGALDAACEARPELAEALRARIASLRELGLVGAPPTGHPERVGDFRLTERIGSGGMGVVYRATQEALGREVALKLIRPELLYQDGPRERFDRETAIVARLQHPGIVPIYTVGDADDLPWYAMELVSGCTLAEALQALEGTSPDALRGEDLLRAVCRASNAPVPDEPSPLFDGSWADAAQRVVRQAAEALGHAHGRGVLHRDLKPSNLMITPEGRVMLVDFGLSQSEGDDSLTGTTDRVGSLPYMPPELLRDGPRAVDRRSDVYGLGVVLYELLTLHKPFEQDGVPAKMGAILEGRPPKPRSWAPGLSWEAETVCLAAMEPDPARRYASADDFAADLSAALDRRPIEARRASALLLARRFVQRKPALALALLLAFLLPTVVTVLVVRESRNVTAALELAEDERDRADEQKRVAEAERERADAERERAETERDRAEEQRALAEANLERSLEAEAAAKRSRDRAVRAVQGMLFEVAEERLDDIPEMHPVRRELYDRAGELFDELAREDPTDVNTRLLAIEADLERTSLLSREGRTPENEAALRRILEDVAPLVADGNVDARRAEAVTLLKLSHSLYGQFRDEESREVRNQAIAILEDLALEDPEDFEMQQLWIDAIAKGAMHDVEAGYLVEVDERLELAAEMARDLMARSETWGRPIHASILKFLGQRQRDQENPEGAAALYLEAYRELEVLHAENPRDAYRRFELADAAYHYAVYSGQAGHQEEVRPWLEKAQAFIDRVTEEQPNVHIYRQVRARVEDRLGVLAAREGDVETAIRMHAASARSYERCLEFVSDTAPDIAVLAAAQHLYHAQHEVAAGDLERADVACARAHELLVALPHGTGTRARRELASERMIRGEVELWSGRHVAALAVLAEAPGIVAFELDETALVAEQAVRILDHAAAEPLSEEELAECLALADRVAAWTSAAGLAADRVPLADLLARLAAAR